MPWRVVVLTVSDRCARGQAADACGAQVVELLGALDGVLVHRQVTTQDVSAVRDAARRWIGRCDLLVAAGGTGLTAQDRTPEALAPLVERDLPGFGEAVRAAARGDPRSVGWRSGAGLAGRTLLLWLPDDPDAVRDALLHLAPAIRHVCAQLAGGPRP